LNLDPEILTGELQEVLSGTTLIVRNGKARLNLKPQSSVLYTLPKR
jgi:hypothetical protein